MQLTQDEGKTWTDVTPPELTPWSKVTHIEASHSDAGTAYTAVDRHRLEDYRAHLYRTRDFGKTWESVSSGIPDGSFLNCVREDPVRKGLLYACTEKGVYVSFDDGDDWQPLQLSLPVTSVRDLVVHEDDLVIATFGRSLWVLDDVTPLRQMDAHVAAADAWLFRPGAAYRVRPGGDQGTPVPMDEALASNPPEGAAVDYYLKQKTSGPVQLEILDSEGKLVRRFASNDELRKTDPKDVEFPMQWVRDPQPLSAEAGMHRFVWDLRYPLAQSVHTTYWGPAGPLAAPGNYIVRLTANGKSSSQPLTIKIDPRVKATQAELTRRFELASRLAARLGEVSSAIQQAGELRKQIETRKKESGGYAELQQALAALEKKIEVPAVPDSEADFGLFGLAMPGEVNPPLPRVASALTGMLTIVESADAAPTADAAAASEKWEASAQGALARWTALQKEEIVSVNASLQKANFKPLKIEQTPKR